MKTDKNIQEKIINSLINLDEYLINYEIKKRKQTLEEVEGMIKNNIDEWWYSLDENHRPFANETNRLIKELLNKLEEMKK